MHDTSSQCNVDKLFSAAQNCLTSFVHSLQFCSPIWRLALAHTQPCFSQCWFRLESRMFPLARRMSSRLVLIIPPQFHGKPVRHAGFTNASCSESLVSCFTPGEDLLWLKIINQLDVIPIVNTVGICYATVYL